MVSADLVHIFYLIPQRERLSRCGMLKEDLTWVLDSMIPMELDRKRKIE